MDTLATEQQPRLTFRCENYVTAHHAAFIKFLEQGKFTDVTVRSNPDGHGVRVHRIIISACSDKFELECLRNPHPDSVIHLNVSLKILLALVQFMYTGQVTVTHQDLMELCRVANDLQLKGLAGFVASQTPEHTAPSAGRQLLTHQPPGGESSTLPSSNHHEGEDDDEEMDDEEMDDGNGGAGGDNSPIDNDDMALVVAHNSRRGQGHNANNSPVAASVDASAGDAAQGAGGALDLTNNATSVDGHKRKKARTMKRNGKDCKRRKARTTKLNDSDYQDRLDMAMKDAVSRKLAITAVSKKYKIPRSNLYYEMEKRGIQTKKQLGQTNYSESANAAVNNAQD